jgi:toxin ParE1/3/4
MSRPVRWSTDALADLAGQIAYIAADNPSAARRVADNLDKTALALGHMPTGRPGRVTGTYEKSVTGMSYVIAYAITQTGGEEEIAIVRVIHTSRDSSAEAWPDWFLRIRHVESERLRSVLSLEAR